MAESEYTYLKELQHNPSNTVCLLLVLHSSGVLVDEYQYHPHFVPDLVTNFAGKDVAIQLTSFPDLRYLLEPDNDALLQALIYLVLSNHFANKHNQN